MKKRPPPPPRIIAIDVDETLLSRSGIINERVADYARKMAGDGFEVWLWSSRGELHARRAAEAAGLTDVFRYILSKPGYVVDDQGWSWIRYTRVIDSIEDI